MKTTARLAIVPLGMSLASFLVITYVLCVLFGIFVSERGMHQLLTQLLPGFTWITWPSFFLGLLWSFVTAGTSQWCSRRCSISSQRGRNEPAFSIPIETHERSAMREPGPANRQRIGAPHVAA
jgi:hypothetical protein